MRSHPVLFRVIVNYVAWLVVALFLSLVAGLHLLLFSLGVAMLSILAGFVCAALLPGSGVDVDRSFLPASRNRIHLVPFR